MPEETAAKLVPVPQWLSTSTDYGAMYNTSDRAVRLNSPHSSAPVYVHKGRSDDVVKLHGHRIELGEVEHYVREHRAVQQCAVLFHENLVAFVTPENVDPKAVQAELRSKVPVFMVPRFVLAVAEFPLTPR